MKEQNGCQDCGSKAVVYEMGRQWCKSCWERFRVEYEKWSAETKEVR